jgi:transcriptional regulator with XRE-family HTH domain
MSRDKLASDEYLSARIREVRGSLSVKEFAKDLGVSAAYIYGLESGKKKNISDPLARLISAKYNISKTWLLTGQVSKRSVGKKHPPKMVAEEVSSFTIDIKKSVAEHNRKIIERMIAQLQRIFNEGDYRKTGTVQNILDILDPKKEE